MCGLFGQLSPTLEPAAIQNASRALVALAHRGPDGSGLWHDGHCVLGHRRLSILDLSEAGAQPMRSASAQSVISFNGEIYNYVELKQAMPPPSGGWRSSSDTEVLLERLEHRGIDGLSGAVGMFAFAWWRPEQRELWLVRDRLGEKPLFYTLTPRGDLVFSSELGPLLATPGVERRTSTAQLAEFLQAGYVSAPRTPFLGIEILPPAHLLRARVRDGAIEWRVEPYWSLAARAPRRRSEEEWLEEFGATLEDAVRITLRSDVPLSALLSGGVDSSVVCLLAAGAANGGLNTLTADQGDASSEVTYAREVAQHIGAHHDVVPLQPVDEADLNGLATLYPELNGDPSALAALAVCRSVRKKSTVVLTGDGGDELGGGYQRYWDSLAQRTAATRMPSSARKLLGVLSGHVPAWLRGEHRVAPFTPLRHPYAAAVMMYPGRASPPVLASSRPPNEPLHRAMVRFSDAQPLVQMMLADSETYIPGDTLMTLDRASMSVSLELRAPLLDYRLFELLRDAEDHFIADVGETKRPFRSMYRSRLPASVFSRRKAGFGVPLDAWLRRLPLEELLLNDGTRDLLMPREVRALLRGYRTGLNHHAGRLWHLVVLSRWLDTWKPRVLD